MPGGDMTGPLGRGPRTGRGLGYCAGYGEPGYANPAPGRGFGFGRGWSGRGWGRGWGWRSWGFPGRGAWGYPGYYAPQPARPEEEKEMLLNEKKALEEEAKALKQELEEVGKRIQELKKAPVK